MNGTARSRGRAFSFGCAGAWTSVRRAAAVPAPQPRRSRAAAVANPERIQRGMTHQLADVRSKSHNRGPMRQLRLALAQINPTVGDLDGNFDRVVSWIEKARAQAVDVIAFPETATPAVPLPSS